MSRLKPFGRLTPSQEAVFSFVSNSTRWLTVYEISMSTGVSLSVATAAMKQLLDRELVLVRKRTFGGWENGSREFFRKAPRQVAALCARSAERNYRDTISGVEPLAMRLRRILGKEKARQYEEFIQ